MIKNIESVGIIGLGYVGLPLAVEFGKIMDVVGFDINENRIKELKQGYDRTHEVETEELKFSFEPQIFLLNHDDLRDVNFFIVTVPTPIDQFKTPDLSPLKAPAERSVKF